MTPQPSFTFVHHGLWERIKAQRGRNALIQDIGLFLLLSDVTWGRFCYLLLNCAAEFGLGHMIKQLSVLTPPVVLPHFPAWGPFLSQWCILGACWRI